jgi:hypothetical protein
MRTLVISIFLVLSACSSPKLPAPSVTYPKPPTVLMEPSTQMEKIPTK